MNNKPIAGNTPWSPEEEAALATIQDTTGCTRNRAKRIVLDNAKAGIPLATAPTPNGQNIRLGDSGSATVHSIRLTKDEQERAKKDAEKTKKAERKKFVAAAEAAAKKVEANYGKLLDLNSQYVVLHRKFADIVEEMKPQFQIIRHFFAHRKEDELLFGKFGKGDDWSRATISVSYHHLCTCLNPPKEQPLLKAPERAQTNEPQPPEPQAPTTRTRNSSASPAGMVNVSELPTDVQQKVLTQIDNTPEPQPPIVSVDDAVRTAVSRIRSYTQTFSLQNGDRLAYLKGVATELQGDITMLEAQAEQTQSDEEPFADAVGAGD